MSVAEALATHLVDILTSGRDDISCADDAIRVANSLIVTYQRALPQPMRKAKKNGRHILGWHEGLEQWCKVRCVPGGTWPPGIVAWQPMPPPFEGADKSAPPHPAPPPRTACTPPARRLT